MRNPCLYVSFTVDDDDSNSSTRLNELCRFLVDIRRIAYYSYCEAKTADSPAVNSGWGGGLLMFWKNKNLSVSKFSVQIFFLFAKIISGFGVYFS